MLDPFESRSPDRNANLPDSTWKEFRAQYQTVKSDEGFVKSLKQISERETQPAGKRRWLPAFAPKPGLDLSPGQWMLAAASVVLLVACGVSYIALRINAVNDPNRIAATDSLEPKSPPPYSEYQPGNGNSPMESDLDQPRDSAEIPSELAVARLVFDGLTKRSRPDTRTRWQQLKKERLTLEETWERVGATLTYAADYETERNLERAAQSPNASPQESMISPLYQVVIDVDPTSHWSEKAKARFEELQ